MIVLVCGGRNRTDEPFICDTLDEIHREQPITLLIEGGAVGVDVIASDWAFRQGIHTAKVRAIWERYGKKAGPMRNRAMLLLRPTLVIGFPSKHSPGTRYMLAAAATEDIPIKLYEERKP